ncbi:hypothetical protein LV779_12770 [Streptomyces thinghirensis]|nr:hypothetical protein [Streptomyces thinghirensis]
MTPTTAAPGPGAPTPAPDRSPRTPSSPPSSSPSSSSPLVPVGYAFWQSLHKTVSGPAAPSARRRRCSPGSFQYTRVLQADYLPRACCASSDSPSCRSVMLLLSLVLALLLDSAVARAKKFFRLVYFSAVRRHPRCRGGPDVGLPLRPRGCRPWWTCCGTVGADVDLRSVPTPSCGP